MNNAFRIGLMSTGALLSGAGAASAQSAHWLCRYVPHLCRPAPGPEPTPVPEIDASSGLLALAAVAAMLLLIWEIRRRRS